MSEAEGVRSLKLQIIYCFALSLSVCESAVQHPKNRLTWDFSLPLVRSRKCWVWIWNRCNNSLLRSDYIFSLIRLLPPALIALRGVLFVPPRESPPPPPLMTQKNKIWRWWLGMLGQFWSNSPVAPSMLLGAVAPSVCILIYNENICFCQPYSRHKYRVVHLVEYNLLLTLK